MKVFTKLTLIILFFLMGSITVVGSSFLIFENFGINKDDPPEPPFPDNQDFNFNLKSYYLDENNEIIISYYLQGLKTDCDFGDITKLVVEFASEDDPTNVNDVVITDEIHLDEGFFQTKPIKIDDPFFVSGKTYDTSFWWQEKDDGVEQFFSDNSLKLIIPLYEIPTISKFEQTFIGVSQAIVRLELNYDENITDIVTYSPSYFFSIGILNYTSDDKNVTADLFSDECVEYSEDTTNHKFIFDIRLDDIKDETNQKLRIDLQYNKENIGFETLIGDEINIKVKGFYFSSPIFEFLSSEIPKLGEVTDWTSIILKFNINSPEGDWIFSDDPNSELFFSNNIEGISIDNIISSEGEEITAPGEFTNLQEGENEITLTGLEGETIYSFDATLVLSDTSVIGEKGIDDIKIGSESFTTKTKKNAPTISFDNIDTHQTENTPDKWESSFDINIAESADDEGEKGDFSDVNSINWLVEESGSEIDKGSITSAGIKETNKITTTKLEGLTKYDVHIDAIPEESTNDIASIKFQLNTDKNAAADSVLISEVFVKDEAKNMLNYSLTFDYGDIDHEKNIDNIWISEGSKEGEKYQSDYDQEKSELTFNLEPNRSYTFYIHYEVNDYTEEISFDNVPYEINTEKLLPPKVDHVKLIYVKNTSFEVETEFDNVNNIDNAQIMVLDEDDNIVSSKDFDDEIFNTSDEGGKKVSIKFNRYNKIKQGTKYKIKVSIQEKSFVEQPTETDFFSDYFWTDNSNVKVINLKSSLDKKTREVSIHLNLINYQNARMINFDIKDSKGTLVSSYSTNDITSSSLDKTLMVDDSFGLDGLVLETTVWQLLPTSHDDFDWSDWDKNLSEVEGIDKINL